MPSFTSQISNLRITGPVVEIGIAVAAGIERALRAQGQPVPPPIRALALVDTGASATVVQLGMAAQLGLHPVGVTLINTPSSTRVRCYEYRVQLLIGTDVVVETKAIEAPLEGQNIRCLIGRDVLAHGVLVYIGYSNLFSLSF